MTYKISSLVDWILHVDASIVFFERNFFLCTHQSLIQVKYECLRDYIYELRKKENLHGEVFLYVSWYLQTQFS